MTSTGPEQLYAWVWLPGATEPVVAGVLTRTDATFDSQPVVSFTYAASYRRRADAISLYNAELPLRAGVFDPLRPGIAPGALRLRSSLPIHGCLRDAAPDAWGRRVINLRLAVEVDRELSELTYLRHSGSDRVGALDFGDSPTVYRPRGGDATLEQLLHAAQLLEAGAALPDELVAAAGHGTSIGGARPKALLRDGGRHLIAKFPASTDTRPVVKSEAASMLLAAHVGLKVAPVEVVRVGGRDVLLVERFDRGPAGTRRAVVSALTVLGEYERGAHHASYVDLAESVRTGPWTRPADTLRELFARMVFNVCVGNTDDHLRNHAAFWDGQHLTLTPAYDLEPVGRNTSTASHAIALTRTERASQLRVCRAAAADFHLSAAQADAAIDHTVSTIETVWDDVCDQAHLTRAERDGLRGREVLNPYIFLPQA